MHSTLNGLQNAHFIDLFAGIGGFHLAMESVGAQCVFASEWDKNAAEVYESNFKLKPHGDITKIKEQDIPKHQVLCAGFPCQAFSISGKRLGFSDTRGTLFFDVARIIDEHKPAVVFLENVKNFAQHDGGKTLKTVRSVLDRLGYDVYFQVIHAAKLGFATARERIYIVGFRKDLAIPESGGFEFPSGLMVSKPLTVADCLQKLSTTASDALTLTEDINLYSNAITKKHLQDHIKKTPHAPLRVGVIGKGGQGNRIYSVGAPAITFSAYGGGRAAKTGAYLIGNIVRKLTPKECATIMGFPKKYKVHSNPRAAYKQFGNSVVVGVVSAIAKKIDETLKKAHQFHIQTSKMKK